MVNRESTDLQSCFRFIRRQMLNVRLYHGSWPTIVAHGAGTALALGAAAVLAAIAWTLGNAPIATLLFGAIALYGAVMVLILHWVERHVQRLAHRRGETNASIRWKTVCALPLTHVVYFACLASASVLGRVSWRGITYEFSGPWAVRMRKYRPYRPRTAADHDASVV